MLKASTRATPGLCNLLMERIEFLYQVPGSKYQVSRIGNLVQHEPGLDNSRNLAEFPTTLRLRNNV